MTQRSVPSSSPYSSLTVGTAKYQVSYVVTTQDITMLMLRSGTTCTQIVHGTCFVEYKAIIPWTATRCSPGRRRNAYMGKDIMLIWFTYDAFSYYDVTTVG